VPGLMGILSTAVGGTSPNFKGGGGRGKGGGGRHQTSFLRSGGRRKTHEKQKGKEGEGPVLGNRKDSQNWEVEFL